jgi:hypothetical protein
MQSKVAQQQNVDDEKAQLGPVISYPMQLAAEANTRSLIPEAFCRVRNFKSLRQTTSKESGFDRTVAGVKCPVKFDCVKNFSNPRGKPMLNHFKNHFGDLAGTIAFKAYINSGCSVKFCKLGVVAQILTIL